MSNPTTTRASVPSSSATDSRTAQSDEGKTSGPEELVMSAYERQCCNPIVLEDYKIICRDTMPTITSRINSFKDFLWNRAPSIMSLSGKADIYKIVNSVRTIRKIDPHREHNEIAAQDQGSNDQVRERAAAQITLTEQLALMRDGFSDLSELLEKITMAELSVLESEAKSDQKLYSRVTGNMRIFVTRMLGGPPAWGNESLTPTLRPLFQRNAWGHQVIREYEGEAKLAMLLDEMPDFIERFDPDNNPHVAGSSCPVAFAKATIHNQVGSKKNEGPNLLSLEYTELGDDMFAILYSGSPTSMKDDKVASWLHGLDDIPVMEQLKNVSGAAYCCAKDHHRWHRAHLHNTYFAKVRFDDRRRITSEAMKEDWDSYSDAVKTVVNFTPLVFFIQSDVSGYHEY